MDGIGNLGYTDLTGSATPPVFLDLLPEWSREVANSSGRNYLSNRKSGIVRRIAPGFSEEAALFL